MKRRITEGRIQRLRGERVDETPHRAANRKAHMFVLRDENCVTRFGWFGRSCHIEGAITAPHLNNLSEPDLLPNQVDPQVKILKLQM